MTELRRVGLVDNAYRIQMARIAIYGDHIAHVLEWRDKKATDYIEQHLKPFQDELVKTKNWRIGDNVGISNPTNDNDKAICVAEQVVLNSKEWNALWGFGWISKNNGHLYIYRHTQFCKLDKIWIEYLLKKTGDKYGLTMRDMRSVGFFDSFKAQLIHSALFPAENDPNRVQINLLNGVFKVDQTGASHFVEREEKKPPQQWFDYTLPFMYDPVSTAPRWEKFLHQVLPEKGAQMVLHEFLACVFFQNSFIKIENALFLVGSGSNGKSVVFDVVKRMFGKENVSSVGLQKLTENRFQMQLLEGKLLNYASEIGKSFEPQLFKELTSQEMDYVEHKNKDPRNIKGNIPRLMFNGNHKPISDEKTHAILRRMKFLPFNVTITEEKQDKELSQKLYAELSGIFNLVLQGLDRMIKNKGFTKSALVDAESVEYENTINSVVAWVKDVKLIADNTAQHLSRALYEDEYCQWCLNNDMNTLSMNEWRKLMEAENFKRVKLTRGPKKGSAGWAVRLPHKVEASGVF